MKLKLGKPIDLEDSLGFLLLDHLKGSLRVLLWSSRRINLQINLQVDLRDALWVSLYVSLYHTLRVSLAFLGKEIPVKLELGNPVDLGKSSLGGPTTERYRGRASV